MENGFIIFEVRIRRDDAEANTNAFIVRLIFIWEQPLERSFKCFVLRVKLASRQPSLYGHSSAAHNRR